MLAVKTIIHEWRKYLAAMTAVAFCGALILSFTGLFSGVAISYSGLTNKTPAHLIVTNSKAASWFDAIDIPQRVIPQLYSVPGVLKVAELRVSSSEWTVETDDNKVLKKGVMVISSDMTKGALNLPTSLSTDTINKLKMPLSVAIDKTSFSKLGVQLGQKAWINGQAVTVSAEIEGFPNASGRAVVFASRETGALLGLVNDSDTRVDTLLVRLKSGTSISQVKNAIAETSGNVVKAWTKKELEIANQKDLFLNGGILGIILIFLLSIGTLIGSVVTWQSIKSAVVSNLREFGSLAALGVSMRSLRFVVIQLSLIVGCIGYALSNIMFVVIMYIAKAVGLPMVYPLWAFFVVGVIFIFIVTISGALSLQALRKSQPADLLR